MKEFRSLKELKRYVPQEGETCVGFNYPTHPIKIYCWHGYWLEKIYWTLQEAAEFIDESSEDVYRVARKKYPYLNRKYQHVNHIKLRYNMLAPVRHMIEQTKLEMA